jgi:outer membrane receptor protein involved in Fe transport
MNETFTQGFGYYSISIGRNIIGVWAQNDWKILPRLTWNLGIRYNNDPGAHNTSYVPIPGLLTPDTNPNVNFAPRLGFSCYPFGTAKTSIRNGARLYFADQVANVIIDEELYSSTSRALPTTISADRATGETALSVAPIYGTTRRPLPHFARSRFLLTELCCRNVGEHACRS